jgi:hypothetical protein
MRKLVTLGLIICLFLGISVYSVKLIMQPVGVHIEKQEVMYDVPIFQSTLSAGILDAQEYIPGAQTSEGIKLRAKAWLEYPSYNIGLGIISAVGFIGAGLACREMYSEYYKKNDE